MMGRILSADRLKAKRTWIGILVVLGPLGVISLQAVNYGLRYDFLVTPGSDVWGDLVRNIHQILVPTLVLGITLLAPTLAGLEHQAQAWKLMFALPVSKVHAYVGKFLRLAVLLLISAALAGIGTVLLGVSLGFGPDILVGDGMLEVKGISLILRRFRSWPCNFGYLCSCEIKPSR